MELMYSSLIYDDPGIKPRSVAGREHRDGKAGWILCEGAGEAPRVVEGGQITLDSSSGRVIVGLPMVADIETMPVEVMGAFGTSVGRKKYINEVNLRVQETVALKAGVRPGLAGSVRYETVKWRTDEPMGAPPRPFSGDKRAVIDSAHYNLATVCIRSDEPTPMCVLAIMTQLDMQ